MDIEAAMKSEMGVRVSGPINQAICRIGYWIENAEERLSDHVHYRCRWEIRGEKIFHVCYESKTEFELK